MVGDYISREAALSAQNKSMNLAECRKRLERLPAADVVEVVRCRECIHRPSGTGVNHDVKFPDGVCPCQRPEPWNCWFPNDDWYCANGKRKDGGQDDG